MEPIYIEPSTSATIAPARTSTESITAYHWHLLFFVSLAMLFEGYNATAMSVALPYFAADFHADSQKLGIAISLISFGTVAAFLPVNLADRYGRRPILLLAVLCYSIFGAATAFSTGLYDFVLFQLIARLFMVTVVGVGSIIITEESPARYRGRAVSLVLGAGLTGPVIAAAIFPAAMRTQFGWRLLYLLAVIMLPVLLIYWRRIRETERWLNQRNDDRTRSLYLSLTKSVAQVFEKRYRRSLIAGVSLWFLTNFWTAAVAYFFPYYVVTERGWPPATLGLYLTAAYAISAIGCFAAGPILDLVGRRLAVCLYFGLGGLSSILAFTAHDPAIIRIAYMVTAWAGGVWGISPTITNEIFPTEIRASANAVVNNLLGRTGMMLAPALVGVISKRSGSVGYAVAFLSLLNFVLLPIIMSSLTETMGKSLEELHEGHT